MGYTLSSIDRFRGIGWKNPKSVNMDSITLNVIEQELCKKRPVVNRNKAILR